MNTIRPIQNPVQAEKFLQFGLVASNNHKRVDLNMHQIFLSPLSYFWLSRHRLCPFEI
jgi:hypothetical protein